MQEIEIRHRNINLVWMGGLSIRRPKEWMPLKLRFNGTAGWWIDRHVFLSVWQLKKLIEQYKAKTKPFNI